MRPTTALESSDVGNAASASCAELPSGKEMSTNAIMASESAGNRYEAVVRISEALAAVRPEALAKNLANGLEEFLHFDHLYIAVLKENSKEIEYRVRGKGEFDLPDLPMEELPIWEAIANPDPVRIIDWHGDQRISAVQTMGEENGLRLRDQRTPDHAASAIRYSRNRSRHNGSHSARKTSVFCGWSGELSRSRWTMV